MWYKLEIMHQIRVFDFQVGQAIQLIYLNPGQGQYYILDKDGIYILNFVADCTSKLVGLNIKIDDKLFHLAYS